MKDSHKSKPSKDQVHDALHKSLKAMVSHAEASGQRDLPHVAAAKDALALAEPEPEKPDAGMSAPEHHETKAEERARIKAERDID